MIVKLNQKTYFGVEHLVTYEETNLVGNVYYTNFIKWQGIVRESFLAEHCPSIIDLSKSGLAMATVRIGTKFLNPAFGFDSVRTLMHADWVSGSLVHLSFVTQIKQEDGSFKKACSGFQITSFLRDGQPGIPQIVLDALFNSGIWDGSAYGDDTNVKGLP